MRKRPLSVPLCAAVGALLIAGMWLLTLVLDRGEAVSLRHLSGDPSALSGFSIGGVTADGVSQRPFVLSGGKVEAGAKTYDAGRTVQDPHWDLWSTPDKNGVIWDEQLTAWEATSGLTWVMVQGRLPGETGNPTRATIFPVEVKDAAFPWLNREALVARVGDTVYCTIPTAPNSTGTNAIYRLDDGGDDSRKGDIFFETKLPGGELPVPCGTATPIVTFPVDNSSPVVALLPWEGKGLALCMGDAKVWRRIDLYGLDGTPLGSIPLLEGPGFDYEGSLFPLGEGFLALYRNRANADYQFRYLDVGSGEPLISPLIRREDLRVPGSRDPADGVIGAAAMVPGRLLVLSPYETPGESVYTGDLAERRFPGHCMVRVFRTEKDESKLIYAGILTCATPAEEARVAAFATWESDESGVLSPPARSVYHNFAKLWARKEAAP